MWVLFFISIGTLSLYFYLLFWKNRKLLKRLFEVTGPKEWGLAAYMVIGLALITGGVYFVPDVPDPRAAPVFQSGLEAILFALSWGILFFLVTISYGFFKKSRQPEFYLLGLLIFFGIFSLIYYPLIHSDYGSQFIHGLLVVGVLLVLSVDQLSMGAHIHRFIWGISWFVLSAFFLWLLFTGISAIFRLEPRPEKALLYTWFVFAGAVWLWIEGLLASGRKCEESSVEPAISSGSRPPRSGEDPSNIPLNDMHPVAETDNIQETSLHSETDTDTTFSLPSPPQEEPVCITTSSNEIPLLRLYCLGPFHVVRGKEAMDAKVLKAYQKPLEILKFIAISPNREVSREEILDYLWEHSEGDKAIVAFQKALSRLRALLDCTGLKENKESYVLMQGGRYSLHPHYTWVDIEEFSKYVNTGKHYREDGLDDKAIVAFKKADELWRGPLLEGHAPKTWLILRRELMEETYTALHIEAAKLLLKNKDFRTAENCVKKSLAINPDSEEGVRIMALAQYAQSKKVEALKNLDDFSGRMGKELKTEPSPKSQKLKTLIRLDKPINPMEWI